MSIVEIPGGFLSVGEDGIERVITAEPTECQVCHAMHSFFIRRKGRMVCVGCDEAIGGAT